jgi:hypothetical protein
MMLSARAVRTSLGALAQARSTFRRLPAEQTTGIDWRNLKADGTKDHPVWASVPVPIETEPSKYDLGVLLALNPRAIMIRVQYESIILSGTAGDRIWSLALASSCPLCLGRLHVERSLGGLPFDCAAYLVGLADFHDDIMILQMIVWQLECLPVSPSP